MYYLGVDLGGSSIKAGIVDENAKIIIDDKIPTLSERGYEKVLYDMGMLCKSLIEKAGLSKKDIHSIGVGCPGIPDNKNGLLIYATNLGFKNTPLRKELNRYIDLPVYIENDANCAALAESVAGASKDVTESVLLTIGTGIGGGIIINNKIYGGFNSAGSELGHMVIRHNGVLCSCGRKGCFERYASASALINQTIEAAKENPDSLINELIEGNYDNVSAKTPFIAQRLKDKTADMVVRQYIDYLSDGIVNIINILFPEIVVIGGGVSKEGDNLMFPLRKAVEDKIFCEDIEKTQILSAIMGNDAGIVGAAMLGRI